MYLIRFAKASKRTARDCDVSSALSHNVRSERRQAAAKLIVAITQAIKFLLLPVVEAGIRA